MSTIWLFTVVIGPLLLLAAIIYATMRYRNRDKRLDPVSDQAARDLRHQLDREDSTGGAR